MTGTIPERRRGYPVQARSRAQIRMHADGLRTRLGLGLEAIDPLDLLERQLPAIGIDFDVASDADLDGAEAVADPQSRVITVSESVYQELCDVGRGRPLFTLAHEVGHLVLGHRVTLGRRPRSWPIYQDSEWQADRFAAELLAPASGVRQCDGPEELEWRYGLSAQAADIRWHDIMRRSRGD